MEPEQAARKATAADVDTGTSASTYHASCSDSGSEENPSYGAGEGADCGDTDSACLNGEDNDDDGNNSNNSSNNGDHDDHDDHDDQAEDVEADMEELLAGLMASLADDETSHDHAPISVLSGHADAFADDEAVAEHAEETDGGEDTDDESPAPHKGKPRATEAVDSAERSHQLLDDGEVPLWPSQQGARLRRARARSDLLEDLLDGLARDPDSPRPRDGLPPEDTLGVGLPAPLRRIRGRRRPISSQRSASDMSTLAAKVSCLDECVADDCFALDNLKTLLQLPPSNVGSNRTPAPLSLTVVSEAEQQARASRVRDLLYQLVLSPYPS